MRRLSAVSLALLAGAGLAPSAVEPDTPPAAGSPSAAVPTPVWSVTLPRPLLEPPRSIGSAGLLLHSDAGLEARRYDDGAPIWSRSEFVSGWLARGPIPTAEGRPVVGWSGPGADGSSGRLVALDAASGEILLDAPLPQPPTAPPLCQPLPRGMPRWSVRLEGGAVVALGQDGRVLTTSLAGSQTEGELLLVRDRVTLVGAGGGPLLLPFRAPGRPRVSGLLAGTALVDGDQLFGAGSGWFARWSCRETRRGRLRCQRRWRQVLGGAVTAPPLLAGSRAIVGSWDTFLYAFERRNGHLAWRRQVGRRLKRELRRLGPLVLVPAGDEEVRAYRIEDGAPAGRLGAGANERFPFGVAVGGGLLVVPSQRVPGEQTTLRSFRWPEPEP